MKKHAIQKKFFIYIFSLAALTLFVMSITVYIYFFKTLKEKEVQYAVRSSSETKLNIERMFNLIESTAMSLILDKKLTGVLEKTAPSNEASDEQAAVDAKLQNIVSAQEYIKGIFILGANGHIFKSDWGADQAGLQQKEAMFLNQMDLPKNNEPAPVSRIFFIHGSISFIESIYSLSGERIGTLIIDLNPFYFEEIIANSSVQSNEKVFIANASRNIIFNYPNNVSYDDVIKMYPDIFYANTFQTYGRVFGKDSILVSDSIENTDWKIVRILSTEQILATTNTIGLIAVFVLGFLLLLAFMVSYLLSVSFTSPIILLNQSFKKLERGDMNVKVAIDKKDEMGQLGISFNKMVVQLNGLITSMLDDEKKKKELELQILKAQINPHFLYNTLDSIRWLAAMQNAENIADMSSSLIRLLKYNISPSELVPLSEELNSIRNYINIQKYRYGDSFHLQLDIEAGTEEQKILKFILQPIVENAIFHGLSPGGGSGTIAIKTEIVHRDLTITVSDDGIGMDVAARMASRKNKKEGGIGIENVDERIKLYFGRSYGLTIQSAVGSGTRVTFKLPLPAAHEDFEQLKLGRPE
ncbi:cache domain-containing sensor histidine kinase [Paenibacillus elgii]|uniref:cache domain-containing sensor histidine kinase n=1 Tax=Paenibacillus elgii TaxID=189691 RepID=UPI00203BDA4D|nr:sensor histidine kinase [Paenibacillus elgii]MCM3270847.1 sensor histidine kinase [Paenibacillus elgii]